ncbi:MAG: protein kinase [Simkaniaceae bacterium]|nr:MAG: protein kinase [Simkaniaceae bacterium]
MSPIMEWATPINTLLNWWAPPERTGSASEGDWVIISDSKPLDLEIKRLITPFLPLKSPEKFEACLAKFSKMVLMSPLKENRFSITILVAFKDKSKETHTCALRILKTDHAENSRMKDRYLRIREGMVGAEWERFQSDERLYCAIARKRGTSEYQIFQSYEITRSPYRGPEYELYATLSHYQDKLGLPGNPFLKEETHRELTPSIPLEEPEQFCFCLANFFPNLTMEQVLGEGKLSKVWLASFRDPSGKELDLALRISRTDSLPYPQDVLKKLFQITPIHWGAEFNAFLMNDPYAVDTHYAIVWSDEGRFTILDKFTIQQEKVARSGRTYTLYATLSPFLEGSKTLTQYLKENPSPSPELIRNFATQLLLGIANLPTGVSHRNLKPDNILVTTDPRSGDLVLKLLDFGFSSVDQTSASDIRGTPLTMAPEMLKGKDYDLQKADMFALYAILHLMITGNYPIQATNMHELQTKLSEYGRSSDGPKEILKDVPFLDQFDSLGNKAKFLDFMNRLGHSKPEARWTARKLLEEDCFLRAPGERVIPPPIIKPPSLYIPRPRSISPPSQKFLMGRLILQITIATGILCIIRSIAKKALQRYINRVEKLPRPNIPVKA